MTDNFSMKVRHILKETLVKKLSLILILILLLHTSLFADVTQVKTEHIVFPAMIDGKAYSLEAMLYTPLDDQKQHPLILMTHGRKGPSPERNLKQVYSYKALNTAMARKGSVVMMLVRRGYGNSDGPDSEFLQTPEESGLAGAQDVKAAIDYIRTKSDILGDRIVVVGQSQGGWIALASATLEIKGVLGAVNISGATNFARAKNKSIRSAFVEDQLDNSARTYGKSSKVPTLWIYAENDNHNPGAVNKWFDSYKQTGGKGTLAMKPPYKDNGHAIVSEPDLFLEDMVRFFKEIGFMGEKEK